MGYFPTFFIFRKIDKLNLKCYIVNIRAGVKGLFMLGNKFINKYTPFFSFIITIIMVYIVNLLNVPNPNVILLTVIVYFSFLGGFLSGSISGIIVIIYSIYFFSSPNQLFHFTQDNLKKIIVIVIFIPIMVFLVGKLKAQYHMKNKELEAANEKLQQLSRLDALTGIANRGYFNEVFLNEYKRSYRDKLTLSLAIIDIDFFKKYNDFYGHISGDNCLKIVAEAITNEARRNSDFIARYGGEEFVIILPNTDLNGAKLVGEKIVDAVASLNIPHETSTICPVVTVSVGIATLTDFDTCDCTCLLQRADNALYSAKDNGRNRVEAYQE